MDFDIEWHDRLGSTNASTRERFYAQGTMPSGLVIAAREQTNGRGRQDRKWLSSPNANLCFSLLLETDAELIKVPSLTMAAALAIADMLGAAGIRAAPKWPNDVLVGDRKICGILSERVEQASKQGIIVGVGLNVNMSSEEADVIDRPATSMLIESGKAYDPGQVLEELLPQLEYWMSEWSEGGFPAIRRVWTEKAGPIGKKLSVHDGDIRKTGTLAGFGEHGELLLKTAVGLETIWSGDVS
jgi:BirA family biotin operon repressor/biotin-[acetyl-CoA-carboxylase] ligase